MVPHADGRKPRNAATISETWRRREVGPRLACMRAASMKRRASQPLSNDTHDISNMFYVYLQVYKAEPTNQMREGTRLSFRP